MLSFDGHPIYIDLIFSGTYATPLDHQYRPSMNCSLYPDLNPLHGAGSQAKQFKGSAAPISLVALGRVASEPVAFFDDTLVPRVANAPAQALHLYK